jgi:hypothetical protein
MYLSITLHDFLVMHQRFAYTLVMPIKDTNSPIYATVSNEQKDKLLRVAEKNHRSLSREIAHALSLYLERYDDKGRLISDMDNPPKPGPKR